MKKADSVIIAYYEDKVEYYEQAYLDHEFACEKPGSCCNLINLANQKLEAEGLVREMKMIIAEDANKVEEPVIISDDSAAVAIHKAIAGEV